VHRTFKYKMIHPLWRNQDHPTNDQ
jgi:hypothetical protein